MRLLGNGLRRADGSGFQPIADTRAARQYFTMVKRPSSRLMCGLAIAAGLVSACSSSRDFGQHVSVRTGHLGAAEQADLVLRIRPAGEVESYTWSAATTRGASAGATFRVVTRVRGNYAGPPRAAVSAVWLVPDARARRRFERSRRTLFGLRRHHLAGFHTDLLLEDLARPGRYLIVGLYGREEDLINARAHPAIADFSRAYPVTGFGAAEDRPLRYYDILSTRLP